jgi:hypothetical protein
MDSALRQEHEDEHIAIVNAAQAMMAHRIPHPPAHHNRHPKVAAPKAHLEEVRSDHDALFSILAIALYVLVGAVYYVPKFGWTGWEVIYFSICTVTTVGYGDLSGSEHDGAVTLGTMFFTSVYAFMGVGMIGLAIADIMASLSEAKREKQKQRLAEQAQLLAAHLARERAQGEDLQRDAITKSTLRRLKSYSDRHAWTLILRIITPSMLVCFVGTAVLFATEDAESPMMQTDWPVATCFYVSIITALSIGYGDFYPTSNAGRGMFCFFIPFAVVCMLRSLEEVKGLVLHIRTKRSTEIHCSKCNTYLCSRSLLYLSPDSHRDICHG